MTQRSILAGENRTIIIKVGASISVKGHESDRVIAETKGTGGVTLERRSEAQIGRARAVIGDYVLFDLRIKVPNLVEKKAESDVIEVQMGGSGEVLVPFSSKLKIYAGKDLEVQNIQGQVDAFSGLDLNVQRVFHLGNASAGRTMSIDCQTIIGNDVTFGAGGDLRFHVADLTSALLRVRDIGGYWEARIGGGEKTVYLKSGGEVTLVTNQNVDSLPPDYIQGKIEKPSST